MPAHAHKDERAQRQYVKLRRKYELKQQRDREMPSFNNPSFNHQNGGVYRKADSGYNNNNNNNQRRNVPNGNLKSSSSSSSNGGGAVGLEEGIGDIENTSPPPIVAHGKENSHNIQVRER